MTHADLLEANVALNRLTNVILHRAPVTKDAREVVFTELGAGGASGIILHGEVRALPMKSVSLDCVDFSGKRFAFFKIDCEGAEGEIIEWICAHLPACRRDSGWPANITIGARFRAMSFSTMLRNPRLQSRAAHAL